VREKLDFYYCLNRFAYKELTHRLLIVKLHSDGIILYMNNRHDNIIIFNTSY